MMRAEADDVTRQGHVSVRHALLHPTVWRLSLLSFTLQVGLYSVSFWLPQIVKSFSGFDNVTVAIVSAIPYVVAAGAMVMVGGHSDRSRERCLHIGGAALIGAIGIAATAYADSPVPGLIALSVAAAGIFSAIPVFWSLPTAFLSGTAAAGAIALINSLGSLGGFVGPYLIGYVRDATGSFKGSLLTIAGILLCGAVLAVGLRRSPANVEARMGASPKTM
jgi:cyanate permease